MICIAFCAEITYITHMTMEYISREIEPVLRRAANSFPAVAVTGARQTGKSTLLRHSFPKHEYVTFDDPLVQQEARDNPEVFFQRLTGSVILDEIQYVPEIARYLKLHIDESPGVYGQFLLTGSEQFSLIRDLGNSLAGRIAILDLLPLSVFEKARISHLSSIDTQTRQAFESACILGSYPQPCVSPAPEPELWYGAYLRTYLERDIRSLHNVGNLRDFQRFMQLLATRCGQMLNASALSAEIGVRVPTVRTWLSLLEAGQVIFLLHPFSRNLGKRVVKSPKIYFNDCGLLCHLLGVHSPDSLFQSPLRGPLFENFVIQEVCKHYLNLGRRPPISYLRTSNGLEIDVIAEHSPEEITAVEIKFSSSPNTRMAENIDRFAALFDKLHIRDACVLSMTDAEVTLSERVQTKGLSKLLKSL